jgi:hypothetical protein
MFAGLTIKKSQNKGNSMRRIIAITTVAVAGFLSLTAQASTVTVDFEEFSVGDNPNVLNSNGYEFLGGGGSDGNPFNNAEVITGTNTGGTNAYGAYSTGLGQDGFNFRAQVTIRRDDGGAFAINAMDYFIDSNGPSADIFGTLAGGGAADLSAPIGTGDWLNLERVIFEAEGDGFGPGFGRIEVDNLQLTAVPVPAAVWLFGSALAGLGWMRRKQTI